VKLLIRAKGIAPLLSSDVGRMMTPSSGGQFFMIFELFYILLKTTDIKGYRELF